MIKRIVFVFFMCTFVSFNANAYIDPGTGSIFVQSILGAIAIVLGTLSLAWQRIKTFFKNVFKRKSSSSQKKQEKTMRPHDDKRT